MIALASDHAGLPLKQEIMELLDSMKETLGENYVAVRFSKKLIDQPCCLATEGPVTLEMEKYFRHGPSEEMKNIRASRVLELNAEHKAFNTIKAAYDSGDKEKAAHMTKLLSNMAELVAGVDVEDPAEFVGLISELF